MGQSSVVMITPDLAGHFRHSGTYYYLLVLCFFFILLLLLFFFLF
jgi:hypothetical protein